MKKTLLFVLAFVISIGVFSQARYPAKVVVLFLGEKDATFDESKFPDLKFYYTPGIKGEVKEVKSLSDKAFGTAGIKKEGMAYDVTYSGSPEQAYATNMSGGTFFDKNGVISGSYTNYDRIVTSPKRNLQGTLDAKSYDSFSKGFIKKGDTTKKAKKYPKKPKRLFDYYGMEIPQDFKVEDAEGNKVSLQSLVTGEPLTLLYVLYIKPGYDFKAGMESGANKKGKKFINDAINTSEGIKKLSTLSEIESGIFGHKVVW